MLPLFRICSGLVCWFWPFRFSWLRRLSSQPLFLGKFALGARFCLSVNSAAFWLYRRLLCRLFFLHVFASSAFSRRVFVSTRVRQILCLLFSFAQGFSASRASSSASWTARSFSAFSLSARSFSALALSDFSFASLSARSFSLAAASSSASLRFCSGLASSAGRSFSTGTTTGCSSASGLDSGLDFSCGLRISGSVCCFEARSCP